MFPAMEESEILTLSVSFPPLTTPIGIDILKLLMVKGEDEAKKILGFVEKRLEPRAT